MQTKIRHGQGSREQSLGTPLTEEGVTPLWSRAAAPTPVKPPGAPGQAYPWKLYAIAALISEVCPGSRCERRDIPPKGGNPILTRPEDHHGQGESRRDGPGEMPRSSRGREAPPRTRPRPCRRGTNPTHQAPPPQTATTVVPPAQWSPYTAALRSSFSLRRTRP